jgi:phosphoserine aminotransferase
VRHLSAVNTDERTGARSVRPVGEWQLDTNAAYLYFCASETIDGAYARARN